MISTLEVNPTLRYLQIDIADLDQFMCINNLIRWHSEMDYWSQSMREDIVPNAAVKLYPIALSKFAEHGFTLCMLYDLFRDFPLAFNCNNMNIETEKK